MVDTALFEELRCSWWGVEELWSHGVDRDSRLKYQAKYILRTGSIF